MKNVYKVEITDAEFNYTTERFFTSRKKALRNLLECGYEATCDNSPFITWTNGYGTKASITKVPMHN